LSENTTENRDFGRFFSDFLKSGDKQ